MNTSKPFRGQPPTKVIKGVACGNLFEVYPNRVSVDGILGQLIAEFPVRGNPFLDLICLRQIKKKNVQTRLHATYRPEKRKKEGAIYTSPLL